MESTRRSFKKTMTAAGIGTAGLALSGNVIFPLYAARIFYQTHL